MTFREIYRNYVKAYWKWQLTGLLFTVLYAIAYFAAPAISGYMIDVVLKSKSLDLLKQGMLLFFLICISQPLMGFLKNLLFISMSERMANALRKTLYEKVVHTQLLFFEKNTTGGITSRIMQDSDIISNFISSFFVSVLKCSVICIMIIGGMLYISWKITLLVLLISITVFSLVSTLSKKLRVYSKREREVYDQMSTLLHQSIGNVVTLKSYRMDHRYCNEFSEQSDKMEKVVVKAQLNQQLMMIAIEGVVVFCTMIIYGIGFYQVMYQQMSLGSVVSMGLYFQMLVPAFIELSNSNLNLQQVLPCFERVESYKQLASESLAGEHIVDVNLIEAVDIAFSYQPGQLVLDQLKFRAERNRMTMICGSSGSGKTTLIRLLMGYNTPTSGKILLNGTEIQALSTDVLRSVISYVQQEVELFPMSVMENIKADCPDQSNEEVFDICKLMGIYEDIMQLEKGFETVVNEQLNLSGGQKQKIGIARALVRKPEILILDEPTSAMDANSEEKLMKFIDYIKNKCTVVVISHRKSTFAYADDLYSLEKGTLNKIATRGVLEFEDDCKSTSEYRAI